MTNNDRQLEKKLRIGLVYLGSPDADQQIIDLVQRHYPEFTLLFRTVDSQPLWIMRGRPPGD